MKKAIAFVIVSFVVLVASVASAQRTWLINYCQSTPSDILDGNNHFVVNRPPYATNCASFCNTQESDVLQDFGASGFTYSYDPNWNDCTINFSSSVVDIQQQYAGLEWYGYGYVGKWDVTVWFHGQTGTCGQQNCWESFEELVWP